MKMVHWYYTYSSESDRKKFDCNEVILYEDGDEENITVLESERWRILSDKNKIGCRTNIWPDLRVQKLNFICKWQVK